MDRLTSMAVFVKAVELGSFTAAAEALELSGPMVGKYVRFLEERLGVRLIARTTRRQSLTDFGRAYYERCRMVLAEADAADALVIDQLNEPHGKLRVTMPVHFGRRCVAPVLLKLAQQYPALELDLSFNDRFTDLADDGYDLAIRTGSSETSPGLVARRVAQQRMVVCASPSYIERNGEPQQVNELASHQAVIYRRSGRVRPWLFPQEDLPAAAITPIHRMRFDDLAAVADAATLGMGMAWLPYWLVRERIESGDLILLLPEEPCFLYDAYAMWLPTPHLPRRVRLAVEALTEALPAMMG
ncbi:LysR family transcriptional regulator [Billgrantia tianxiuensis]|uniref:LysR family transcriptional regulator n=2 Tax=Oceanospirillales TaxID=135619 RepID=A0A6I6SHM7_9GAMM|nr:LysR family transcriptional regulator [Halomonas sp. MCCC 1A11057]QHC50029.1 LysR family transcriptional regulator [Halomonas tianxiuensis]